MLISSSLVSMAETDQLGIGILGAASIAKKNCRAIAKTRTGVGELLYGPHPASLAHPGDCLMHPDVCMQSG